MLENSAIGEYGVTQCQTHQLEKIENETRTEQENTTDIIYTFHGDRIIQYKCFLSAKYCFE